MRWILPLLIFTSPIAAAEENAYLIAFTEGRYEEAAQLIDHAATPDSLAFAARSLLADAMSATDYVPPTPRIEQAETYARRALVANPNHVEARLQLAIALSLKARPLSTREAMRSGYGEQAKALVESVLEDDPENAYAHGFLSVWHVEVRRRGGAIGASIMGASIKKARIHYRVAIEQSPGDASIHWQYARALTALNAKKYRKDIETALQAALTCGAETTLEHVMQDRARLLQTTLHSEKRSVSERVASEML